jgi:hypothetical protein
MTISMVACRRMWWWHCVLMQRMPQLKDTVHMHHRNIYILNRKPRALDISLYEKCNMLLGSRDCTYHLYCNMHSSQL